MSDRFSSSPSENTAPQTALEKLFAFYQQELSKKYETVQQSLQAFNQSLIQAGQDNAAVVNFQNKVTIWYTDIEVQLKQLNTQGETYAQNLQARQDELQDIITQYEALVNNNRYTSASNPLDLPKPLQEIASHRTQLRQAETRLSSIETEFANLNQTISALNAQIQALQAGNEKIAHARAMLRDKLNRLMSYYGQLLPEYTTDQKYHDVYNYLRVAIETCPAEAFDSSLVEVIGHTISAILRCIETAINRKKGIFGKNDHWLEYHYKHPARAISTLQMVAQEKLNQFNPSQSS